MAGSETCDIWPARKSIDRMIGDRADSLAARAKSEELTTKDEQRKRIAHAPQRELIEESTYCPGSRTPPTAQRSHCLRSGSRSGDACGPAPRGSYGCRCSG